MAALLINVRVRVQPTGSDALFLERRDDSYFDITNIKSESDEEAIGYALSLAHECFGLPLRMLHPLVTSKKPIIDC